MTDRSKVRCRVLLIGTVNGRRPRERHRWIRRPCDAGRADAMEAPRGLIDGRLVVSNPVGPPSVRAWRFARWLRYRCDELIEAGSTTASSKRPWLWHDHAQRPDRPGVDAPVPAMVSASCGCSSGWVGPRNTVPLSDGLGSDGVGRPVDNASARSAENARTTR